MLIYFIQKFSRKNLKEGVILNIMKVLMALMLMEIGGAETHVLELAKALNKRGMDVYVVSSGGVYVKELEEVGIKHFTLPLHNKHPHNLLKSYWGLKKIIKKHGIKLVHAHARIPAFLCGLLKSHMEFYFVTTTHGIYKTDFPLNILTKWGEHSIAVSEDIRKYLIENYDLPEKNIALTINGINTEKFKKEINYQSIVREFDFDLNKKRIITISRLDKDQFYSASHTAHKLLECAEDLYNKNPNIEIVIVGDGNDFKNIKAKADKINEKMGFRLVYVTGARTDINEFLAISHVFVGISRAALEAMSSQVPVILAGHPGYIGIYDESKKEMAFNTNFCCRDCEPSTAQKMQNDCLYLLDQDEHYLKNLGDYGRQTVLDFYSVNRMANDAIQVYNHVKKIPLRKNDVIMSGYYGSRNSGDEALLQSIVQSLRCERSDIRIIVLSRRPQETRLAHEVKSIYWLNIPSIMWSMKNTRLLISGGGNLMQDETSTRTLVYYLTIIKIAKLFGTKVMLYANGIGPVKGSKNKIHVKNQLNTIELITIREEKSLHELKKLGVLRPTIHVTADAAFALESSETVEKNRNLAGIGEYFIISLRSWKRLDPDFENKIASLADYVKKIYNLEAVFVAMQPQYDIEISKKVQSLMKNKGIVLTEKYSLNEMFDVVQNAKFVLGMRLHTLIYAAKAGVPVIGLVYDPKIEGMMEYMKQHFMTSVEEVEYDKIVSYIATIIDSHSAISEQLRAESSSLKEKAKQNTQYALELLDM